MIHFESNKTLHLSLINSLLKRFSISNSIISSVVNNTKSVEGLLKKKTNFLKLSSSTQLSIHNFYTTPRTLGMDRVASLTGAHSLFSKKNILVISAGTCITYDAITAEGNYFGGNISPGLDMRLKALNTFTARLPLVKKQLTSEIFGKSTSSSILTGVIGGARLEMKGFITGYKKIYPALKVIITGGDASYFETISGNKIFAVPHLALYGLNEILLQNHA